MNVKVCKCRSEIRWILLCFLLLLSVNWSHCQSDSKKVLIHYMGWFGEGSYGRHWQDGQPREPIIGYYDSGSWATQLYHILISWSCGIDGLVINVRDAYDDAALNSLPATINRIVEIEPDFLFEFAISYDDQGMNSVEIAKSKLSHLKNNILPNTEYYLHYNLEPVIFIWNYSGYLSPVDYSSAIEHVFSDRDPVVIWNEIDESAVDYVNSFYPWVQGFSADGSNWGQGYLTWFYNTIASNTNLDFATAGVWPGFDDRQCSWGQDRWIDRNDGLVYDETWKFVHNYNGTLPLKWVYIETWNDWNEGSEIEPSSEFGFSCLQQTIEQISAFKNISINLEDSAFLASTKIYEAALLIENSNRDSTVYYPLLRRSVSSYIDHKSNESIAISDSVINGALSNNATSAISSQNPAITCYPNPAKSNVVIHLVLPEPMKTKVDIFDSNGRLIKNLYTGDIQTGTKTIEWDTESISRGSYICSLTTPHFKRRITIILH